MRLRLQPWNASNNFLHPVLQLFKPAVRWNLFCNCTIWVLIKKCLPSSLQGVQADAKIRAWFYPLSPLLSIHILPIRLQIIATCYIIATRMVILLEIIYTRKLIWCCLYYASILYLLVLHEYSTFCTSMKNIAIAKCSNIYSRWKHF